MAPLVPAARPAVVSTPDEAEAEVAVAGLSTENVGAIDGDAPQWPDDAAESAFLSEGRESGGAVPTVPRPTNALPAGPDLVGANVPLPPLQSLIDRIPAEARDVLDELFRARFVSVKRVQAANLK